MTTEPNRFGPFIGGCVGGVIGYLAGAAFGPLAAVILFFLGAYVGYEFKTAARYFGRTGTALFAHSAKHAHEARDILRHIMKYWYAYALWVVVTGYCFNCVVGDSTMHDLKIRHECVPAFDVYLPYTLDVLQTVVTGESRYFERTATLRFEALFVVMVFGFMAGVLGAMFTLFIGMSVIALKMMAGTLAQSVRVYKQWPLTAAWLLFWALALPTFGLVWVMAVALIAMCTARRLTCALITVAAGVGYLYLVPVPAAPELVGAAAIGCGLTCGLAAHGLFALVGHRAVMTRLQALRKRTIRSFAPLPELPWWRAHQQRRAIANAAAMDI